MEAFRDSLRSQEFVEFRCPVLMGSPSEGGADVFEVIKFAKEEEIYDEELFEIDPILSQ